MRRIVPTMMAALSLFLATGSTQVNGQADCSFEQGFADLRALVGEQKVGACLENEHVNADNGNTEQRSTGGLMVWRNVDNFTAFTDGGTTWVNGPNGLESRPNSERLAWERDPVTPSSAPPSPLPTLPPRGNLTAGPVAPIASIDPVTGGSGSIASPYGAAQARGAGAVQPAPPTPPAAPGVAATPTRTPTPKPAITAKFVERPDDVDTGNDAHFEVETSAKKGSCTLNVTYRNSSETPIGARGIDDDGRCEWKFTLPTDVKTGKAKAIVIVSSATGETATLEDTFEVEKGDTVYAGSVNLEVDPTDLPGDVEPGQEIKIGIDTNLKRKGSCELMMTWPKVGAVGAASQMPDERGRCSWRVTVPPDVPRNSSANLLVTVRKDGSTIRTLTKDFEVKR